MSDPRLSRTTPDVLFISLWKSQMTTPTPSPEPEIVPSLARPALCRLRMRQRYAAELHHRALDRVTAALNSTPKAVIFETEGDFLTQAGQTCLGLGRRRHQRHRLPHRNHPMGHHLDCDNAAIIEADSAAVCTAHGFVYWIDVSDGHQAWQSSAVPQPQGLLQAAHETIYLTSGNGRLYALDQHTGKIRWSAADGGSTASPVTDRSQVYVAGADGRLYAFDALTGTRVWSAPAGCSITTEPGLAGSTVYIGAQDGRVYALNRTNGNRRWSTSAGGGPVTDLHAADGRVTTLTDQDTIQRR